MNMDVQTISIVIAAAGVFIAAINSIISSRRAEQQRQADLFQQIHAVWRTPEYQRAIAQIRRMEFTDFDDYLTKFGEESNAMSSIIVGTLLWGIGTLVNKGFVDIDLVDRLFGHDILTYWERVKPVVPERRKHFGRQYAEDLEYLSNVINQRRGGNVINTT
jgi:hypothetical protein